jgi:hypothetical protein
MHKVAALPLKQMDGLLLSQAITALSDGWPGRRPAFDKAIQFAAYYHRTQTRASRAGLPRTHYIEHPLARMSSLDALGRRQPHRPGLRRPP